MTTLRILFELTDHQGIEAVEAKPHVCFASGHENARGRAQAEHPATPAVTSGRANPHRRALESGAATRTHRSLARPRSEALERERSETGRSAPRLLSASSRYSLHDP